jgi:hypothetical protein
MLISERYLRNIIRETLLSEATAAALADTIRDGDYADPDDISYDDLDTNRKLQALVSGKKFHL